jgi:hypothetical protein
MVVQRVRTQQWLAILVLVCTVGLSACASVPRPTGTLSQAELAVREAERSEAPRYAPLELQTARENLDNAKLAMQNKAYEKARRLAEKALVEAELAEDKASVASTRQTVDELRVSIESLRDEITRASRNR